DIGEQVHAQERRQVLIEECSRRHDGQKQNQPAFAARHAHSTENASSTFPGAPPKTPDPELVKSMPPTTTGPGPSIAPPLPGTPLTVVYSRAVSMSQMMRPSFAA